MTRGPSIRPLRPQRLRRVNRLRHTPNGERRRPARPDTALRLQKNGKSRGAAVHRALTITRNTGKAGISGTFRAFLFVRGTSRGTGGREGIEGWAPERLACPDGGRDGEDTFPARRGPLPLRGRLAVHAGRPYHLPRRPYLVAIFVGLRRALPLGLCVADSFGEHLAKLSLGLGGFTFRWLPLGHRQLCGDAGGGIKPRWDCLWRMIYVRF
jgi:hypothetical protein